MDKFSARETEWMLELDGIPLAGFWRRAFAFAIDWFFVWIIMTVLVSTFTLGYMAVTHQRLNFTGSGELTHSQEAIEKLAPWLKKKGESKAPALIEDIVGPVLYFGLLLWKGKGRTPGKRLMKIRV